MKRNHRVLWPALTISCLFLITVTFAASHKLRRDPLQTAPLCRNGYRLIQQQQDDPRSRCLTLPGQYAPQRSTKLVWDVTLNSR